MSFISTFSSASIKGWTAQTTDLRQVQIINGPANANLNYGGIIECNGAGNIVIIPPAYANAVGANIYKKDTNTWSMTQTISGTGTYPPTQVSSVTCSNDGNIILLGYSSAFNSNGINTGQVYYFEKNGNSWTQIQEFTGNDSSTGDSFGGDIVTDNDGNWLAVSAGGYGNNGAIYTFTNSGNNFVQQQIITSNIGAGQLGADLVMNKGYANVIASVKGDNVIIFTRSANTFSYHTTISGNIANLSDWTSISINDNGNLLVLGQPNWSNTGNLPYEGAVRIYEFTSNVWTLKQSIFGDLNEGNNFGETVLINAYGNILFVSAPRSNGSIGTQVIKSYILDDASNNFVYKQTLLQTPTNANTSLAFETATNNGGNILFAQGTSNTFVDDEEAVYIFVE